jgi:anthranilate phosphoribosyltransferase
VKEDSDSCDSANPDSIKIEEFTLHPTRDFGLPTHPLSTVAGGKLPSENAEILKQLMRGELKENDPILDFVTINTAALFVVSGLCDEEGIKEEDKWRRGVELVRYVSASQESE